LILRFRSKFKNIPFLIIILSGFTSTAGFAFPDLIRKGYTSCLACHVSPAGGGVLTSYGRGVSSELSTFRYEGAGEFFGIPSLESIKDPTMLFSNVKFNIQPEWRQVNMRIDTKNQPSLYLKIPMQTAVEGAFHVGDQFDLVFGYGKYGPGESKESRTHYLQTRTSEHLQLRAGRFLPAFGLNLDDHTAFVRSASGISQGRESVNLEAHLEGEIGSLTLTRTFGHSVVIEDSREKLNVNSADEKATLFRATVKLSARHYVGGSCYYDHDKKMLAAFLGSAPIKDRLYFLAEFDHVETLDQPDERLLFLRSGSEIYHGIVVNYDFGSRLLESKNISRHALSLQLMLIPHSEFRIEARKEEEAISYLLMSHLWL